MKDVNIELDQKTVEWAKLMHWLVKTPSWNKVIGPTNFLLYWYSVNMCVVGVVCLCVWGGNICVCIGGLNERMRISPTIGSCVWIHLRRLMRCVLLERGVSLGVMFQKPTQAPVSLSAACWSGYKVLRYFYSWVTDGCKALWGYW